MKEGRTYQTVEDLVYLTACALHNIAPEAERLAGMDLTALFQMATQQSMSAITCMALEAGGALTNADPVLAKQWRDSKNKATRKNMLLDAECREILEYMEAHGIWYMPLKGAILKDFYPKYGMRQMADYDILFDSATQIQMQKFMSQRGYMAKGVGKGCHDAYYKAPVYNFELHRTLFSPLRNQVWFEYYRDIRDRLVPDEDRRFGYHFSDEDFYIYITTHACKHYGNGGTGLRSLVDCYVYCQKKGASLDWTYIRAELNALGIAEFEQQCRELAACLFSAPKPRTVDSLTEKQQKMLAYLIGSGTYGTIEHRVENRLRAIQPDGKLVKQGTRWHYIWRRLVPDQDWFRLQAPFCLRHKWAIPFFLIYRMFRGLILQGGRIWQELQVVQKVGRK